MEEGKKGEKRRSGLSASLVTGAIALVFLVIGYETALFLHRAASLRLSAHRDHPDTVYVVDPALAREVLGVTEDTPGVAADRRGGGASGSMGSSDSRGTLPGSGVERGTGGSSQGVGAASGDGAVRSDRPIVVRKSASRPKALSEFRDKVAPRRVESFRFNPNTVSVEDLQRLGFSLKQAESIDHYRQKGGRFRRKSDFARSYVVADSVYERLEPYIDIPRLDINRADSAAFTTLPGIGKFFAGKMVSYRKELGGYSCVEQLLDIWHFDEEKLAGIRDLITCSQPEPWPLWTAGEAELRSHPYIRGSAHGIVLYRTYQPREKWTLEGLRDAGVLSEEQFRQLSRCRLAAP